MSVKGISFLFCLVKDCVWNINWYSKRFYKPKTYFDEQKYFKTWQGYNKMCLMILDLPKDFGWVPIVLDGFNLLWSDPNYFGQVQIIKISPEKSNLNLTKMIWTIQNHFWSIEGTRHKLLWLSVQKRLIFSLMLAKVTP